MLQAVGIEYDGRYTQYLLPSPTDPARLAPDGSKWWNPDWLAGLRDKAVREFLKYIVALILQNEESVMEEKVSTMIYDI